MKKSELIAKYEQLQTEYERVIRILMDHAIGLDLSAKWQGDRIFSPGDHGGLTFLKGFDISGLNFVGVSVGGQPVRREMLQQEGLKGFEDALVEVSQIDEIKDPERKLQLQAQMKTQMAVKGVLIKNDVINLIPLWRAAEIGDIDALKARLDAGGNPNEIYDRGFLRYDEKHKSAIVLAAANGHEAIVDILSTHPQFDRSTLPDAILAAGVKYESMKMKLHSRQDIDQLDDKKMSLLHHAVYKGDVKEVESLIARGANVNLQAGTGYYPLQIAAKKASNESHLLILQILLANGADPNVEGGYPYYNALQTAAEGGSLEAVKLLLPITDKKPLEKRIPKGLSETRKTVPWFLDMMFDSSRSNEWFQILKVLKDNGADLGLLDADESTSVLHQLFSHFPSPHIYEDDIDLLQLNKKQQDSIHDSYRVLMQYVQFLDFLLENNIPLIKNRDGNNALHRFIDGCHLNHMIGGYARIIDKFLRQKDFDINAKNAQGKTLLHIAAAKGDLLAVKYLISRDADVNAKDKYGNTALHYASGERFSRPYPSITSFLLQSGARTNIRNNEGLTALKHSENIRHELEWSESFSMWNNELQRKVLNEYGKVEYNLSAFFKEQDEPDEIVYKPVSFNDLMQNYIQRCKENMIHLYIIENLSEKDRLLIEMYRDDVTHNVMQTPVVLNERVYDLDTLLSLHREGKPDPYTQHSFDLSDIEPAEQIAKEIHLLMHYLQQVYPSELKTSIVRESSSSTLSTPGENGLFGRSNRRDVDSVIHHPNRAIS